MRICKTFFLGGGDHIYVGMEYILADLDGTLDDGNLSI